MRILLTDQYNKQKEIGDTKDLPIPRIGERVVWDFLPSPMVTAVNYNYDNNLVVVVLT